LLVLFTLGNIFYANAIIPGIKTMKKYGTKMTPEETLVKIGEILNEMGAMGSLPATIYNDSLRQPNTNPVFILESLELNNKGFATQIEGYVTTPSTFKSYVSAGGFGVPIYEAVEPNEFGVIFGRNGNIAVREGVIVKKNPLQDAEIYELQLGSETYDKIMRASVLFQTYEIIRQPYLENVIVEFQGMLLNSASKDAILEGIKKFKSEHKNMSEQEVVANYLKANKTYLDEIKKSNDEARKRIRESRKMMDAISSACSLQVGDITKLFLQIAADIAKIVFNIKEAGYLIPEYVRANIPKNSKMTFAELQEIQNYNRYMMDQYIVNSKKNLALWKTVMDITKDL
jgi:hypothetical protein